MPTLIQSLSQSCSNISLSVLWHRKILGNIRGSRTAGTSETFEVLANLERFGPCAPKKQKNISSSKYLVILAPQGPRTITRSWQPSHASDPVRQNIYINILARLMPQTSSPEQIWLNCSYDLRYGSSRTMSITGEICLYRNIYHC